MNVPNLPTQATKIKKSSKSKSKTTSSVSQKTTVAKTTKSKHVGSVQVGEKSEGTGENQRTQKNNVGEGKTNHPRHVVSSQQGTIINMDIKKSLSMPSKRV